MNRAGRQRQERGTRAHRRGHLSEYAALIYLMLTGHRILGFRLKTPEAEIDILAQRGSRLSVVEVKQRRNEDEARTAVLPAQRLRLCQAGERLQARRPHLARFSLHLDLCVVTPRGIRLIRDAFTDGISGGI